MTSTQQFLVDLLADIVAEVVAKSSSEDENANANDHSDQLASKHSAELELSVEEEDAATDNGEATYKDEMEKKLVKEVALKIVFDITEAARKLSEEVALQKISEKIEFEKKDEFTEMSIRETNDSNILLGRFSSESKKPSEESLENTVEEGEGSKILPEEQEQTVEDHSEDTEALEKLSENVDVDVKMSEEMRPQYSSSGPIRGEYCGQLTNDR